MYHEYIYYGIFLIYHVSMYDYGSIYIIPLYNEY